MILPPFQIKKPNCPFGDFHDVTLGSPAIFSAEANQINQHQLY
jgi:hypothetical protein